MVVVKFQTFFDPPTTSKQSIKAQSPKTNQKEKRVMYFSDQIKNENLDLKK